MKLTRKIGLVSADNFLLSNANMLFSFYTVQNIYKGVVCQAFLWALPTNDPCHPRSEIEKPRQH